MGSLQLREALLRCMQQIKAMLMARISCKSLCPSEVASSKRTTSFAEWREIKDKQEESITVVTSGLDRSSWVISLWRLKLTPEPILLTSSFVGNRARNYSHESGKNRPTYQEDRHLPRSGLMDQRGNPKKGGAGGHNWGIVTDELAELDYEKEKNGDTAAETNREFQKIKLVNPEEFEILSKATEAGKAEAKEGLVTFSYFALRLAEIYSVYNNKITCRLQTLAFEAFALHASTFSIFKIYDVNRIRPEI
ncbi:hypothetical protein G9A89_006605 [Geosiphon pyriformis]|nr:hypothetical protein G9A89_006605 [Geosiphon pyriformis]